MIYLAIMSLTVFDAWATWLGVTRYGIEEGNALARLMFEWSIPGTCVLAVLLTGSMLLVRYEPSDFEPRAYVPMYSKFIGQMGRMRA